jgi:hypothetical protein
MICDGAQGHTTMRDLTTSIPFEQPSILRRAAFSNPGWLYNAGNAVAFFGALLLCGLTAPQGLTANSLSIHLLGNTPATLTTVATLLFWISGLKYAAAWSAGFPPEPNANAAGHALSTCGAILIGFALMALARSEVALALAIVATIMHAGGKLASWRAPDNDGYFKAMPLYSRVPYATTLFLDLRSDGVAFGDLTLAAVLPCALLIATLFWARADWLLLPKAK